MGRAGDARAHGPYSTSRRRRWAAAGHMRDSLFLPPARCRAPRVVGCLVHGFRKINRRFVSLTIGQTPRRRDGNPVLGRAQSSPILRCRLATCHAASAACATRETADVASCCTRAVVRGEHLSGRRTILSKDRLSQPCPFPDSHTRVLCHGTNAQETRSRADTPRCASAIMTAVESLHIGASSCRSRMTIAP